MRKKILFLVSMAAFVFGISIFAAPSTSHAIVINNVTVTVGGLTACISGCGAGSIWGAAAGTDVTATGAIRSLVLTQTAGFNFDTSEGNAPNCAPATPCTTTLNINGTAIPLSGPQANILANNNADIGGAAHNEASNWNQAVFNGGPGGFIVWFGYADNAHTDACADTTGTVASNCLPDNPWQGSPFTQFVGAAGGSAGAGGCTRSGVAPCFDAGAIRIEVAPTVQGPEPTALFLLVTGLIGLAAWRRESQRDSK
jgi:hypothetical protein